MGKFYYACPGCGQAQVTRDPGQQGQLCAACLETKGDQLALIEADRQRKLKTLEEQQEAHKARKGPRS